MKKLKIKKYILLLICTAFAYCSYFAYAQQTSSLGKDSDNDGLIDTEESIYKTDPLNPDTDGDGYSDGVEIKSGYDPLKPAPDDKLPTSKSYTDTASIQSEQLLTEKFAQTTRGFLETRDGQTISPTDLDVFINDNFSSQMKEYPSFDNLPDIDRTKIKIKKQDYGNLNEEARKEKKYEDTKEYLVNLLTLFYSNLPEGAISNNDITTLYDNILIKLGTLSTSNPDYTFFRKFANKMSLALDQVYEIEVPEELLDDHIQMLRIVKGFLQIKDDTSTNSIEDPLSQMIILTRGRNLMQFTQSFLIEKTQKIFPLLKK